MSEKALAIKQITPADWQMIQAVAPVLHQSRLFGVSSPEQAMAIALKGFELGLSLTASFEYVVVIQGKPALVPRGALALILNSGQLAEMQIDESQPDACTVYMKRKSGIEYRLTWTIEDAKRAGLVKDDSGWIKYPANMLRWRVLGWVADVVFPDVIGGMKRADELGAAIDTAGNVVDGEWRTAPAQPAATEPTPSTAANLDSIGGWGLNELIEKYGADAVLEAAGGAIPTERSEIARTWKVLEAKAAAATATE